MPLRVSLDIQPNKRFHLRHTLEGGDISPRVSWSEGPSGTLSYALLMTDPDVPADLSLAKKEGEIPANAPRQTIYHWVLADIPSFAHEIPEGAESGQFVPKGKPFGKVTYGMRGINAYSRLMAADPEKKGFYGGYDGPRPPSNDLRLHRYTVRVVALDVATLGLGGPFEGGDLEKAIQGHILDEGEDVGTWTRNPQLAQS